MQEHFQQPSPENSNPAMYLRGRPQQPSTHLTARAALQTLDEIHARSAGFSVATARDLCRRELVVEATDKQISQWQTVIKEAADGAKLLSSASRTLSTTTSSYNEAKSQAESIFYNIRTFSWLGSGAQKEARERANSLSQPLAEAREHFNAIRDKIESGKAAGVERSHFTEIAGHFFKLTGEGENLRANLAPRAALLTGRDLDDFRAAHADVMALMDWRVERARNLASLLKDVGFDCKKADVINNVVVLSTLKLPLEELLVKAAEIDTQLARNKLSQEQRLNIVSLLMSGERGVDDLPELRAIADRLAPVTGSKAVGYRELYVAAHILERAANVDVVELFTQRMSALEKLGFKKDSGLCAHLAARLTAEPDESFDRFKDLYGVLAIADQQSRALSALSLQRLAMPNDRIVERLTSLRALIPNSSSDIPLIAAIAGYPGLLEPRMKLLTDIGEKLKSDSRLNQGVLAKSFIIYVGIVKELAAPQTLAVQGENALRRLETCGIERSVTTSRYSEASSSAANADSGDSLFFYQSDSATHSALFDSSPAGSIHDLGSHGTHGALCGTTTHGHGHSDGGGQHHGDSSSAHSGGHASHSSCAGHSGGHSCSGHSGGHSCSGGGHSCGGGHGCGGHGCGGGGCGGH